MKTLLPILALSFALVPAARAQTEAAAPTTATTPTPAEREAEALWAQWRTELPAGVEHPQKAYWEFQDAKYQQWRAAVRAFLAKHPGYPKRNELIVQSGYSMPFFITGFKPGFDEAPNPSNFVVDEAARAAAVEEQMTLNAAVIEDPAASYRERGGAYFWMLAEAGSQARKAGRPLDLAPFRAIADRVVANFGDERVIPVVEQYLGALRQQAPTEADAYEAELKAKPAIAAAFAAVAERQKAEQAQAAEAAKARATDLRSLKFTAADGREVDVAQLKGKVVLVDFWATWCGPCIAELPNVKKVYAAFHDQGFEVIGISLENSGVRPTDKPEQAAPKLAKAKQKLLDFVAKHEMPWPQHFDGKHFKNEFAVKFGINAIPAMFLLDKNGQVVAADARGEKLEAEVKRLLGL